ncbi:hypothetical protein FH181_12975, partial [Staphylococcus warneri]
NALLEQSKSANRILERYDDLNNGTEITKLRNEIDKLEHDLDKAVDYHEEDEQEKEQLRRENKRLSKDNDFLKTENKKQSEVISGVKDAFHSTMNSFEKILGQERFKNCVLKVDSMLNHNQYFRNLVVGFDDKYKNVFTRNDKLNLAKENMYVSQDINIKDMENQIVESELETSDSLLTLEINVSDKDFKQFLEEPDKYIVVAPVDMDGKPFLISLDDIDLDKPLEFDKDLGLGESQEIDMDLNLER